MHADVGDWLVVLGKTEGRSDRRAQIVGVESPTGLPPYRVRWLDTGHEALVFPGPDSHVVTSAEQTEHGRLAGLDIDRAQAAIEHR